MRYITILVCLFLLAVVPPTCAQTKSPGEIAREQAQAVVIIEMLDARGNVVGQGSGFIVTPTGAVVTNLHVVQGAAAARVKLPNGDVYKTADVIDADEAKDLVILKLKGFQLPTVTLGDSDGAEIGEAIVVISSPEGLVNSLSTGVISGMRRLETHRVFQITAPISQGSSGGALFNARGAVIGIITYVFRGGQNINFAVPVNYARGMIGEQATRTLAQLPAPPVARETNAAAANITRGDDAPIEHRLSTAVRGRLGRTPTDPMFERPFEGLALFYRLVEGLGRYREADLIELLRTAALEKTGETATSEEYAVNYLSASIGLGLSIGKTERTLSGVELIVNWSLDDLERTFGDKYRKRTVGGRKELEFNKQKEKDEKTANQIVATLDDGGNVRSVRFTRPK